MNRSSTIKKSSPKLGPSLGNWGIPSLLQNAVAAQELYATYTQAHVDRSFKSVAQAANLARIPLAKLAVNETGRGIVLSLLEPPSIFLAGLTNPR